MVYRKRTYRKKKLYKKRVYRKRTYKPRVTKSISQPVHFFKRHVDFGSITADGIGTDSFGAFVFELNDVPGYTEFTALYDFYKIVAVKIMFTPFSSVTTGSSTATYAATDFFYRLITVVDYNDASLPLSLNELREYSNCKVTNNNRVHKRFFYPKVDVDTDFQMKTNPWVNTSDAAVKYNAIKYGFEQPTGSTVVTYRVECVYYMKFKAPR